MLNHKNTPFFDISHYTDDYFAPDILDYLYHLSQYLILPTIERGIIIYLHTNKEGNFQLPIQKIKDLFELNHCTSMITCYPKAHSQEEIDLFNIQYTDYNTPITSTFTPSENEIVDYIDDDDLAREKEGV
jgi:hypothetical protein